MGRRRYSPPKYTQLVSFLNKLNISSLQTFNSATSQPIPRDSFHEPSSPHLHSRVEMTAVDGILDEGFHEEWPPFSPSDLMGLMSPEQSTGMLSFLILRNYANQCSFYERMARSPSHLLSRRDRRIHLSQTA
jgi:hypothetical protein